MSFDYLFYSFRFFFIILAFLTAIIMPFTFSITNGIAFGLLSALAFYIITGQCFTDLSISLGFSVPSIGAESTATELTPLKGGSSRKPSLKQQSMDIFLSEKYEHSFQKIVRSPSLILNREDSAAVRKARGASLVDNGLSISPHSPQISP